jgi:hypothetical protein|nr:MAG TPA: hypothetical protein [Bacteriophage sp.]
MKIDLFNLADLDKAIAITDNHKADMKKRMMRIMEKVRQEAVFEANRLYQSASYAGFKDVIINATPVHVEDGKITFTLRAMGSTTLFIEFGTGIYPSAPNEAYGLITNGNVVMHGQYGKKQGLKPNGWFYKGVVGQNPPSDTEISTKKGGLVHTCGNAATPFMYSARKVAEETFNKLIKELK